MRKLATTAVFTIVVVACSAPRASAEWLLTPYAGYNWGGAAKVNDVLGSYEDQFGPWFDFGASVTWPKGAGALGFEFDFGYHPQFFEQKTDEDAASFPRFDWGDSRVMTFMGNVNYSPGFFHTGKWRWFATGGAGMIQIHAADALFPEILTVDTLSLGVNGGGGVVVPVSSRFQVRADVRYFRSLEDKQPASEIDTTMGNLYFWRSTVGVTFHLF
jgi:hypothetical protein